MNLDDPKSLGLLSLGLRLMSTPGKFGPALGTAGLGAVGDMQQAAAEQRRQQAQLLQQQMLQMQIEQMQRQNQRQAKIDAATEQFRGSLKSPWESAVGSAMQTGQGPTPAAAAALPQIDQNQQLMFDAMRAGLVDPLQYVQTQQKEAPKLQEIDPTKSYGTWQGGKFNPVLTGKPKDDLPSEVREYQYAQSQGYKGSFEDWKLSAKRAGATSVSVTTGQKGYENESKLRNDFKTEPIYKDFQDMQSAYKQIKAGIAQGTPIGDVATATKIMKLLDPGSVVRESELGIAMAAGGRMDRMKNYVQMQISGEKLTPQMRVEFGALADELYKAASQTYEQKRSEYDKLGKRYGLDTSVLGDSPKVGDGKVRKFNPATGRIE